MGQRLHKIIGFLTSERGATAAEFALVFPVFAILTLSVINISMLLFGVTDLHFASQKTARCIALKSSDGVIAANNCLTDAPSLYTGPMMSVSFSQSAAGCGNTVTGAGSFKLLVGLKNVTVPVSASSCYPLQ